MDGSRLLARRKGNKMDRMWKMDSTSAIYIILNYRVSLLTEMSKPVHALSYFQEYSRWSRYTILYYEQSSDI